MSFPAFILAEIFSHMKEKYSVFRVLDRDCNQIKIPWDGLDAIRAQENRNFYFSVDRVCKECGRNQLGEMKR